MRDRISNEAVVEALQKSGGNRRKAAADLGITVQALRRKIGLIPKNSKLKIPPALRKGTANCTHIELGNYKLPDDWEGNPSNRPTAPRATAASVSTRIATSGRRPTPGRWQCSLPSATSRWWIKSGTRRSPI